jgi:hypothetical protein
VNTSLLNNGGPTMNGVVHAAHIAQTERSLVRPRCWKRIATNHNTTRAAIPASITTAASASGRCVPRDSRPSHELNGMTVRTVPTCPPAITVAVAARNPAPARESTGRATTRAFTAAIACTTVPTAGLAGSFIASSMSLLRGSFSAGMRRTQG